MSYYTPTDHEITAAVNLLTDHQIKCEGFFHKGQRFSIIRDVGGRVTGITHVADAPDHKFTMTIGDAL